VFSAGLILASALVFGVSSWTAFFTQTLPYQNYVAAEWQGVFLRMMPTWFGGFRAAGLDPQTALTLHVLIALPIAGLAIVAMMRTPDQLRRSQLMLAASFALTPYGFHYDLGALLTLLALTALQRERAPHSGIGVMYAAMLAMPLWAPLTRHPDGLLILPALLLSVLVVIWSVQVLRSSVRSPLSPAFP
jgi:arabinofuranan 3-O-arabinosyltransferase